MSRRQLFLELIAIALDNRERFSENPTQEQWEFLYECAKRQTLAGVLCCALDKVAEDQRAPIKVYLHWHMLAEKIAKANERNVRRGRELSDRLRRRDFRSCILKGQGNAAYYPDPSLRQGGDIDIWVEGSRKRITRYFQSRYRTGGYFYHHFDAYVFSDVEVEVHFTPSWMNCPTANRKMQEYFASRAEEQFSNFDEKLGYCVPTASFACVHAFIHTFRHIFHEGVGLRQVMDCHYLLKALTDEERREVAADLGKLGLGRFTAAMMGVLQEVFGLEDSKLLCQVDEDGARVLLTDTLRSGNFGHYSRGHRHMRSRSIFVRGWFKMRRLAGFIRFSPGEFLTAPLFKVWQHFLRKEWNRRIPSSEK